MCCYKMDGWFVLMGDEYGNIDLCLNGGVGFGGCVVMD